MTVKETHVTPEGLKKMEAELEHLKTVCRKNVAEKIKVARGYGDLSENAEYDAASDELSTDQVGVGITVRVEDLDEEDEDFKYMEFAITGATEADPDNNKISDESPVGAGLIGKKVGEVAEITLPTGAVTRFKVLSIERS